MSFLQKVLPKNQYPFEQEAFGSKNLFQIALQPNINSAILTNQHS